MGSVNISMLEVKIANIIFKVQLIMKTILKTIVNKISEGTAIHCVP